MSHSKKNINNNNMQNNKSRGILFQNAEEIKFPQKKIILGDYVRIEPLNTDRYIHQLFENLKAPEFWYYLRTEPPETQQVFYQFLKGKESNQSIRSYMVFKKNTQEPIGIFSFSRISQQHRILELSGVVFGSKLQNTTQATQTLYLISKYIFEECKFMRMQWACNVQHRFSIKAAIRFGFRFQGILRRQFIVKKNLVDVIWFSQIASQWPQLKNQYERWLNKNNFDNDMKQLSKLYMPSRIEYESTKCLGVSLNLD